MFFFLTDAELKKLYFELGKTILQQLFKEQPPQLLLHQLLNQQFQQLWQMAQNVPHGKSSILMRS